MTRQKCIEIKKNSTDFVDTIVDQPESVGCPLPCRMTSYKISVESIHKHGWAITEEREEDENHFILEHR